MTTIFISPNNPKHLEIIDQMETLSLQKKIVFSEQYLTPILSEDGKEFIGEEAIYDQLQNIKSFLKQWYACLCD